MHRGRRRGHAPHARLALRRPPRSGRPQRSGPAELPRVPLDAGLDRPRGPGARGYWTAQAVAAAALGGVPAVDIGTGFALAPLWDGDWRPDELAKVGLRPDQMPVVVLDDDAAGQIGNAVQACPMADAWAEAMVAGANAAGDALVICGTTLIVWGVVAEPAIVPGMWNIPHPLGELNILGGASNAGGMFVNWARRALAGSTPRLDPDGLPIWVPYLKGERTPIHDATLRASLHGVDISHDASALTRAAYEASAFAARRMIELGAPATSRIVASGGGVHDEEWMHALADCTGLPVDTVAVPEGAALGAAWRARVAAGLDVSTAAGRWARHDHRIEPDPKWVAPCEQRYQRWKELAAS